MKKLYFFAAAALVAMGAVSCVDNSGDEKVDSEITKTVDLEVSAEESSLSPAEELKTYGQGEAVVTETQNEKCETEITVSSPETETVEGYECQGEQEVQYRSGNSFYRWQRRLCNGLRERQPFP